MALSQDFLLELHERNDIVEVIGSYLSLNRRGRLYTALCPFHNEKTASFTVYPDTQSYYCFGCGSGGDVITFIKNRENLEYIEAVQLLAARAGMTMPDDRDDSALATRKRIYELNRQAARFFHEALNTEAGKNARAYLRGKRRLSDGVIRRFGIGYAPPGWSALRDHLRGLGFQEDELVEAGLCARSQKSNSVFDFFRDRVMFPVIDVRGNVVAFSGRTLGSDPRKYLNTRDTPVFKKSRVLYALNIAKSTDTRRILVAEGQMDVIALHEAGFSNAVAALGTALTEEHARMIGQYADEVILCYDADEAGQKATRRAIDIFKNTGLAVRVIVIPGAKDPDEFIRERGADQFRMLLEGSANATEYELARARKNNDLESDAGRVAYLKDASAVLARLSSPTERDLYAGRVADEVGVTKQALLLQIDQIRRRRSAKAQREQDTKLARSVGEPYHVRGMGGAQLGAAAAERRLVALLYANPDLCARITSRITAADFISAETGGIFESLVSVIQSGAFQGLASLSGALSGNQISLLSGLLAQANGINFTAQDADFLIDKMLRPKLTPDKDALKQMDADELMALIQQQNQQKGN